VTLVKGAGGVRGMWRGEGEEGCTDHGAGCAVDVDWNAVPSFFLVFVEDFGYGLNGLVVAGVGAPHDHKDADGVLVDVFADLGGVQTPV